MDARNGSVDRAFSERGGDEGDLTLSPSPECDGLHHRWLARLTKVRADWDLLQKDYESRKQVLEKEERILRLALEVHCEQNGISRLETAEGIFEMTKRRKCL